MSTLPQPEECEAPAAVRAAAVPAVFGLHAMQEEWGEYAERLEHYYTANDITSEDKRRAILLNGVGPAIYRFTKTLASPAKVTDLTLASPAKVTDLTFEEIVARTKQHFNPKPSPIVKRYEFNIRQKGEGENIATFVAELRKIAEYYGYGGVLKDMLHDRVVCGISHKGIQRRLLQESDLTFDKALEIVQVAETAERDFRRLRDREITAGNQEAIEIQKERGISNASATYLSSTTVHKVGHPRQLRTRSTVGKDQECHRCGGKHLAPHCNF